MSLCTFVRRTFLLNSRNVFTDKRILCNFSETSNVKDGTREEISADEEASNVQEEIKVIELNDDEANNAPKVTKIEDASNSEISSKILINYLGQDSPLKSYKGAEWATTPYPVGTFTDDEHTQIYSVPKSIIMFPGQGNQYVGMCKNLLHHSLVKDMFDAASTILGYDLLKICLNGPKEKLNQTVYSQPATVIASLAALEELKERYPFAISECISTCGFSLGEITALIFSGAITFDRGIYLTKVRAEAMQACSSEVPGGMMTILYGADSSVSNALKDAKSECLKQGISDPVCEVASHLIYDCKVIAGHNVALEYIKNNIQKYKIRRASRLPVSGAFHTILMRQAAEPVKKVLGKVQIKDPLVTVMSCTTGKPYRGSKEIVKRHPSLIYRPVKWQQLISDLYHRTSNKNFPHTYECGPGKSLTTILKTLNSKAALLSHNISV